MTVKQEVRRVVAVFSPHSTRAAQYFATVRPELEQFVTNEGAIFHEIGLEEVPYFAARDLIARQLQDGDVVVSCGGDGTANVTGDAVLYSGKDVMFAVVPLGHSNDFARGVNGRAKTPSAILSAEVHEFHPLLISINGKPTLHAMQYFGLGASAAIAEFLNSSDIRTLRQKQRGNIVRLGLYGARHYARIFRDAMPEDDTSLTYLSRLKSGEKRRLRANDIMFMTGAIGSFFHPAAGDFHLSEKRFWFHHARLAGRVGDVARLSRWAGYHLPGEVTTGENLAFLNPIPSLPVQVGGDKLILSDVQKIACVRAKRPIKLFMPRAGRLQRFAHRINREKLPE